MKKILCALLALALVFSLAACGAKAEPATHNDAGYYALFSLTEDGETMGREVFDAIGWTAFLQLDEDGTGVLDMGDGDVTQLTWQDGSLTAEGDTVTYVLAGGMLTLDLSDDDGETVMIFQKSDPSAEKDRTAQVPAEDPTEPVLEEPPVEEPPAEEPAAEESPAQAPAGEFTPVSGDLDGCHVEIVGAEAFTDSDGKDAVRFYYDFTNTSDEITSPWLPLYFAAEEDGYQLVTTYTAWGDEVPEDNNEDLYVQPGASIRCVKEYSFQTTGSVLTFELSDYGDDPVTAVFDVQALPGRPTWDLEITPIPDPQYFRDYPTASADDNIAAEILDAEVSSDSGSGEDCVRVIFSLTNNTDEAQSPLWLTTVRAYQDGVQLPDAYTEDDDGLEDAYYDDVEPGETVQFAYAWRLRSDSPVEVTLQDYVDYSSDILIAGTVTLE